MSESPVNKSPAIRDGEVEEPLGVRAAGFLLQNFAPVLALTIAGGVVGGIAALALPQPYVDNAVIEIGARTRNEPLENPIQAGWRVRGAMLDAARDLGVELDST